MTRNRRKTQAGAALVEFVVSFSLLATLAIAAVSFGMAVQQSIMVADAANAGASWGANSLYNASNLTAIQWVALKAGTGVPNLTAVASSWCTCSGSSSLVTCPTSCGTSSDLKYFVQVNTSATFTNFFSYLGLPASFTLKSIVVMPVE